MGFPWQGYWSGLSFLSLGDLCDPRIEPMSPALAIGFFTNEPYHVRKDEIFIIVCFLFLYILSGISGIMSNMSIEM